MKRGTLCKYFWETNSIRGSNMCKVPEMKATVVFEKKHGGQYRWSAENMWEEYWIGPRF